MKQWHTLKQLRDQSHYHFQNLLYLLEDLKKTKKPTVVVTRSHYSQDKATGPGTHYSNSQSTDWWQAALDQINCCPTSPSHSWSCVQPVHKNQRLLKGLVESSILLLLHHCEGHALVIFLTVASPTASLIVVSLVASLTRKA